MVISTRHIQIIDTEDAICNLQSTLPENCRQWLLGCWWLGEERKKGEEDGKIQGSQAKRGKGN